MKHRIGHFELSSGQNQWPFLQYPIAARYAFSVGHKISLTNTVLSVNLSKECATKSKKRAIPTKICRKFETAKRTQPDSIEWMKVMKKMIPGVVLLNKALAKLIVGEEESPQLLRRGIEQHQIPHEGWSASLVTTYKLRSSKKRCSYTCCLFNFYLNWRDTWTSTTNHWEFWAQSTVLWKRAEKIEKKWAYS